MQATSTQWVQQVCPSGGIIPPVLSNATYHTRPFPSHIFKHAIRHSGPINQHETDTNSCSNRRQRPSSKRSNSCRQVAGLGTHLYHVTYRAVPCTNTHHDQRSDRRHLDNPCMYKTEIEHVSTGLILTTNWHRIPTMQTLYRKLYERQLMHAALTRQHFVQSMLLRIALIRQ